MTRLQQLALTLTVLAAFDARAGTGLTNAGVTQQGPGTQEEPTLAQVAPNAANNASAPVSIAGNPVNGTTAPVAGVAVGANAPGASGAAAVAAATPAPRVVTPPPPPDPATLPVSVIKPLNRPASETTAAAPAAGTPPVATSVDGAAEVQPSNRVPRPAGPAKTLPTGSTNLPVPAARVAGGAAPPRPEPPVKAVPETPPEEPADASSGSVIFYSGSGIAALILLLSFGAFVRSGRDESA